MEKRKINAIIEKASDGSYSIYMDATDTDYLATGTGMTVAEAKKDFESAYEAIRKEYASEGKPFEEVEFNYIYDIPSFLQEYAYAFTLAGLERITGVNQKQLGHYISGFRKPSPRTAKKIQDGVRAFCNQLSTIHFA